MPIDFPAYRNYHEARVAVSDAQMALLIGARLGQHVLRGTRADPRSHLPALFNEVTGIERVNRTVADSERLLQASEHHLASMGIPYVLGVQSAFLSDCIDMLREDGKDKESDHWAVPWRPDPRGVPLSDGHEYIAERCGADLPTDLLETMQLARRIRNRILHFAGRAGSRLPGEYRTLSRPTRERWESFTGRPLQVDRRGTLELSEGELIAVLATTRHLAAVINDLLAETISRPHWARLAVQDYRANQPQRFGEKAQRTRRLMSHARVFYGPLALTPEELEAGVSEN